MEMDLEGLDGPLCLHLHKSSNHRKRVITPRGFFLTLEVLAWFRGDQSVCRDNLTIMKGSPCLGLDLLHYATKGI